MSRIRGIIHARKANKATAERYFTASETDWEHLRDLEVEGIDDSDIPEPTPEQLTRAVLRRGLTPVLPKHQVTLRLDTDVLSWFRAQGAAYQTPINQLLRAYMEAHRHSGDWACRSPPRPRGAATKESQRLEAPLMTRLVTPPHYGVGPG